MQFQAHSQLPAQQPPQLTSTRGALAKASAAAAAAAAAAALTGTRDGAQSCGWYDSSFELNQGLEVIEAAPPLADDAAAGTSASSLLQQWVEALLASPAALH